MVGVLMSVLDQRERVRVTETAGRRPTPAAVSRATSRDDRAVLGRHRPVSRPLRQRLLPTVHG